MTPNFEVPPTRLIAKRYKIRKFHYNTYENQQIKSDVCANRFYQYIQELKDQVSEYLDKQFGRWC